MTPLTLKCDNPSIECGEHSVQVVGTVQITTTPDALANATDILMHSTGFDGEPKKPAKRKALTGKGE